MSCSQLDWGAIGQLHGTLAIKRRFARIGKQPASYWLCGASTCRLENSSALEKLLCFRRGACAAFRHRTADRRCSLSWRSWRCAMHAICTNLMSIVFETLLMNIRR